MKTTSSIAMLLAAVAALALFGGCGSGDTSTDGGTGADGGPGSDAGKTSADDWATIPNPQDYPYLGNVYTGIRDAPEASNYTCLNQADTAPGSELASVTFTGTLLDFQNSTPVVSAEIAVWTDLTQIGLAPVATATSNAADGTFSITVTGVTGKKRLHWRSKKDGEAFPTFELNDPFDVTAATQTTKRTSVSLFTATALPALAGIRRTDGTGVLAGAVRDCDRKYVGNAIATVLGADGKPIPGVKVVYVNDNDTPSRRDPQIPTSMATNPKNGIFVVIDIPPTTTPVKLVVDGNLNGVRTRLSEFSIEVWADNVIIVDNDPKRAP